MKAQAAPLIDVLRGELMIAHQAWKRSGVRDRGGQDIEEIANKIGHMASDVEKIPDDAPTQQAFAQMHLYLRPSESLRKTIRMLTHSPGGVKPSGGSDQ